MRIRDCLRATSALLRNQSFQIIRDPGVRSQHAGDIRARVLILERACRRSRNQALGCVVLVFALLAAGFAAHGAQGVAVQDHLRVRRLEIVDSSGAVVAALVPWDLAALPAIQYPEGLDIPKLRQKLAEKHGYAQLVFSDPAGGADMVLDSRRLRMYGRRPSTPIQASDQAASAEPIVQLTCSQNYGVLELGAPDGDTLVYLGPNSDIAEKLVGGHVEIRSKTGTVACTLAMDEQGNGIVGAWNRTGKGRTLASDP